MYFYCLCVLLVMGYWLWDVGDVLLVNLFVCLYVCMYVCI